MLFGTFSTGEAQVHCSKTMCLIKATKYSSDLS